MAVPAVAAAPEATRSLVCSGGDVFTGVGRDEVEARLASGEFFWLDLTSLGADEMTWLRDVFRFHPLAIEDAEHFGQRPKIEEYEGYLALVLYGSGAPGGNWPDSVDGDAPNFSPDEIKSVSEVHCFISDKYLVTVHRDESPAFVDLARRMRSHAKIGDTPSQLFYRVADTLVDSFFPILSELDDRIDLLQAQVISRPTNKQLGELLQFKSSLITLRRVVTPQRDVFARLSSGAVTLPGSDDEGLRYFRDVYDHLIRLSDLIDGYRDLLSSTTDAYLSVVSNQLNEVMKQLTIIATIFLPLSFLTGFFGQNFGWLVNHLTGLGVFIGAGLGTEALAVVLLLTMFRRRGWLGNQSGA